MCMKHRTQWGLWVAWPLFLSLLMGLFLFGCDQAPFEPIVEESKDYPVYFADWGETSNIFIYHPGARTIDSVNVPYEIRSGITVSADGKRLYLGLRSSVVVVDAESFKFITELPYDPFSAVSVSPDNEYLAITGDDLYILRTSDYEVVFSDTDKTEHGRFSSDSRSFYCVAGWTSGIPGFVYKVDLSDGSFSVQRKSFAGVGVFRVVPSLDETKWFLYLNVGLWTSTFEVYDVLEDSITFRQVLIPGLGDLALTPDGRRIYYTNPGSGNGPTGLLGFTIFDVNTNVIDTVVEDADFFTGPTWAAHPNLLAITPDGRWLAMIGGSMALLVPFLYDIDKRELVYIDGLSDGLNHVYSGLSTQVWK